MINEPLINQILNLRAYNGLQVPKVAVGIRKAVGEKPKMCYNNWAKYIQNKINN